MISASMAETHRFGRVKKNGYDPAEVDAVIARLVDALRRNDERIAALTEKIDAADASADAIRKTFVAAQDTRDQIIEAAEKEAAGITESAAIDADVLAQAVEELEAKIAASRDRLLVDIYREAEHHMTELETAAALRSVDAAWAVKDAEEVRNKAVSDSEAEAQAAEHSANLEAAKIRAKIATMAQAAVALEEAAEQLANSALEGAKVIDLTALEQLDASRIEPSEAYGTAVADAEHESDLELEDELEPDIVVDAEPELELEADHDIDSDEESQPTLVVAEAPPSSDEDDEGPATRYQRSTGVPLKERIKIARLSG